MAKNKKTPAPKKQSRLWLWLGGGAVVLVLIAALVWFASANSMPRAMPNTNTIGSASANPSDITANLPNTQNAFNVGTRVGKPAPAFTLPDAQGKPFSFQPGDGKKYVLAFNMGYS